MLPVFQKIDADINHSFYVGHRKSQYFPNPFMFHPEVEILLVLEGTGTRIIRDSIGRFGPGELVMIGPAVPHLWYSDEEYLRENSGLVSEVIFILFKPETFGEQFLNLPELRNVLKLFQLSEKGIKVTGKASEKVASLMIAISNSQGFKRISLLISILEILSSNKEFQFLSSPVVQNVVTQTDADRLNKVYKYVINNFQQGITIERISSIANLSASAFCHYFKKRTNKTFIRFLTEIRIAFACRLLTEDSHSVEKICYSCGYTNVSYFIRQFKEITGLTPLVYRKNFSD